MNEQHIMDFDTFVSENYNSSESNDILIAEDFFSDINEQYELDVIGLVENFSDEIAHDLATLNESEQGEMEDILPLVETLLDNPCDIDVIETVMEELDEFDKLDEVKNLFKKKTKKPKGILGKVKAFATELWEKLKKWIETIKAKISKEKNPKKKKGLLAIFKKDKKKKSEGIKAKIVAFKEKIFKKKK